MVITRFQPESALRELVHLTKQVERALQHVAEIQNRSLVQGPPVLIERDLEHLPDTACQDSVEIPSEHVQHALDLRCDLKHRGAVLSCVFGRTVIPVPSVGMNAAAATRSTVGGQKMRPGAIEHSADLGVAASFEIGESTEIAEQQLISGMFHRSLRQK